MKNETEKMRDLYDQWQTPGISKQAFCIGVVWGTVNSITELKDSAARIWPRRHWPVGSVRYQFHNRSYMANTNRRWQQSLYYPEHV